ncbi:MAG: PadR family transcriptional regulator [Patescibacteria group bacterium]
MPDLESPDYWQKLINQGLIRFFLLKALKDEALYGYVISQKIDDLSWGACKPTEGTLYPALNQLQKEGYVTVHGTIFKGRERKVYQITPKGKSAFRIAAKTYGEIMPLINKAIVL